MSFLKSFKFNILKRLLDIRLIALGCLTIGLAPFTPEPHILGKVRWITGGAKGMQAMDWFDSLLHGFPWLLLAVWLFAYLKGKFYKAS